MKKRIIIILALLLIIGTIASSTVTSFAAEKSGTHGNYTFNWTVTVHDNYYEVDYVCTFDPGYTNYYVNWGACEIATVYKDEDGIEQRDVNRMYYSDVEDDGNGGKIYKGYFVTTYMSAYAFEWNVVAERNNNGTIAQASFTIGEDDGLIIHPTVTPTPTPTSTPTPKPTDTPTATPKPTSTPKPTTKPTSTPTATSKPTSTPKPTATPKPTNTPKPTPTNTPTPTPSPTPAPVLRLDVSADKSVAVANYYTGGCTPVKSVIEFYEIDSTADKYLINSETFLSGSGTMKNNMELGKRYIYRLLYVYENDGVQYEKEIWSTILEQKDVELEEYRANKKIHNFRTLMLYIWEELMMLELPIEGFRISFRTLFMWVMIALTVVWFLHKHNS